MSFNLDGSNEFSVIGSIINNKKLSPSQVQKRKFMYLEGLIRFLELYANNEIGNVEVDIEKIALWINSPHFENIDVYKINNIKSVYTMLTNDLMNNIPLYRFLRLDDYKLKILETEHYNNLLDSFYKDAEKYPCLKCIFYSIEETDFGRLSQCKLDKDRLNNKTSNRRPGYHDITKATNIKCKYCTTINNTDQFINDYVINNTVVMRHNKQYFKDLAIKGTIALKNKINNLDNSYIPITIPDSVKLNLADKTDLYEDLGRVFGNKLSKEDMRNNYRFAIFLEAMIKFIELYAQNELGSDYIADIGKIAMYLSKNTLKFNSKDEFYSYLENQIIDGFDMITFCKRKDF